MTISMYQASAAVFARGLASLAHVLRKGAEHAAARKIDDRVFLDARLYPDMLPLAAQVRIATDFSRGACARLAGSEPPKWEDNETTLAELIARVERALEAVRAYTPAQIDGSEAREITRPIGGTPKTFTGLNYLLQFVLPNFYFHAVTAYAILRHNGVEIGKSDYIGALD
jgi:hypothetical protein